jgi:hypothetical protein
MGYFRLFQAGGGGAENPCKPEEFFGAGQIPYDEMTLYMEIRNAAGQAYSDYLERRAQK